ncbi:MAG: DUF1425 domain-containing protein [Campylobacteraceae bacterium]|jgi:uncharacterized protein YcfL|nr:DUF1425 domain-containing protein [Campylobacteraceae bacterium]
MRKMFYLLAFLALILTSCADKSPRPNAAAYPNIVFENDSIKEWFALQNVVSVVRDDGFIEVEVTGKNISSSKQILTYNVDWYDQNGFTIKSILVKRKIASIENGKSIIIHVISPSANAQNYKVRFGLPTSDDELRDQNVNLREYKGE